MKTFIIRLFIFLLLNFGALALGGLFTSQGVASSWYQEMNKAPWTPPGWLFGFAWTLIMVCYSLFMASVWNKVGNKRELIGLFSLQWILNVAWNPLFFYLHLTLPALVDITALTILIYWFIVRYAKTMKIGVSALIPYALWLTIATSLNAYIWLFN